MKKKRILTVSVAVLVALLCVWRLWPHSLKGILDINEELFSTITVQVSEFGVSNGSPNYSGRKINTLLPPIFFT